MHTDAQFHFSWWMCSNDFEGCDLLAFLTILDIRLTAPTLIQ